MIPWKRYISPAVGVMIALFVVTTLVAAVDLRTGGRLWWHLALVPDRVLRGEVWRLVTWAMVTTGPLSLVFGCFALYQFGGDLAERWGQRRFVGFVATVVLAASIGTTLAAQWVPGVGRGLYLGFFPLGAALVIAWSLQFPERRVNVLLVFLLGGPMLTYGTYGFVLLCVVFFGVAPMLPALIATSVALYQMSAFLPRPRR